MKLKLTTHEKDDVVVVEARGRLTLGEGTRALRTMIRDLVARGSRKLLLDLAHITYIDSSGLGEIVAAHSAVAGVGGDLKLLNLDKRAHGLLWLSKLYTVFETFEDEASAVRSFPVPKPAALQLRV